ncbi:MAG: M23 family metallopeptidase [Terriglobia bacterium]
MTRLKIWILGLAVMSVAALVLVIGHNRRGMGQGCGNWMTPGYSQYTSSSADGTYVYTSVAVNGTTYGNCPFGCDFSCSQTTHYGRAYNVIGHVGGWQNGYPVVWNSHLYEENDEQVAASPGTLVSFSCGTQVICSVAGLFFLTSPPATQVAQYTHIQHNYPRDPLPQPCWISQFFDAVNHGLTHHAEDVVYDNGQGAGGVKPPYGTPVYAMEAGKVVAAPGNYGPAPEGYPACAVPGGTHTGNYVKIQAVSSGVCAGSSGDGYSTIYFHVKPLGGIVMGACVSAGQEIGTLDKSGCQSGAHTHIARKNPSGIPVNFTIPCTNPIPTTNFWDGLVGDYDPDSIY